MRLETVRRLLPIVVMAAAVFVCPQPNGSPMAECKTWPSASTALQVYDAVFVGRLISVAPNAAPDSQYSVCYEVMQTWKGPAQQYEEVIVNDGPRMVGCAAPPLSRCEIYLVHVRNGIIGCCNPTRPVSKALDEITELGKPVYRNSFFAERCEKGA
jgi:hypothetical protein